MNLLYLAARLFKPGYSKTDRCKKQDVRGHDRGQKSFDTFGDFCKVVLKIVKVFVNPYSFSFRFC